VQQLHATEQRQRDLVDLMQEAVWVHAEGKILFANPAAVRFFAAGSMAELLGRPSFGWVHPDDRERAAERTKLLTASPCSVPVTEMRLVALDGKVKTAALHAVSFLQDGKLHVMASALDVTALREAECSAGEAIMLGDTPYDVQAASKVNVPTIALRCGGHPDTALSGAFAIYDDVASILADFDNSVFALRH
jgi:PAS domain S-box-containing protein